MTVRTYAVVQRLLIIMLIQFIAIFCFIHIINLMLLKLNSLLSFYCIFTNCANLKLESVVFFGVDVNSSFLYFVEISLLIVITIVFFIVIGLYIFNKKIMQIEIDASKRKSDFLFFFLINLLLLVFISLHYTQTLLELISEYNKYITFLRNDGIYNMNYIYIFNLIISPKSFSLLSILVNIVYCLMFVGLSSLTIIWTYNLHNAPTKIIIVETPPNILKTET